MRTIVASACCLQCRTIQCKGWSLDQFERNNYHPTCPTLNNLLSVELAAWFILFPSSSTLLKQGAGTPRPFLISSVGRLRVRITCTDWPKFITHSAAYIKFYQHLKCRNSGSSSDLSNVGMLGLKVVDSETGWIKTYLKQKQQAKLWVPECPVCWPLSDIGSCIQYASGCKRKWQSVRCPIQAATEPVPFPGEL